MLEKEELLNIRGGSVDVMMVGTIIAAIIFVIGIIDGIVRPLEVESRCIMSKDELMKVYGGAELTTTLINSFAKIFDLFFGIGQSLGTSIRKIKEKSCVKLILDVETAF